MYNFTLKCSVLVFKVQLNLNPCKKITKSELYLFYYRAIENLVSTLLNFLYYVVLITTFVLMFKFLSFFLRFFISFSLFARV